MPFVVPQRLVAVLIPCLLAAVVLCLAGCAKAPPPSPVGPPPPGGSTPLIERSARQVDFNTEEYGVIVEPGFAAVVNKPLSTFSIDVDTAAYANVRRFLHDGRLPPADAVRIEELINYFDYDYPDPAEDEPFSIVNEMAACPWAPSHRLVHIGLRSKPVAKADLPPNNLVFLIDVSGSMNDTDKLPLLKKAFSLLVEQLRPQDQISIVVYAGAAGMVLPPTTGAHKTNILSTLSRLDAGGSTAGGAGIYLAYKLARENFIEAGNNRVILATDGDFNVGVSSDGELVKMIERERESGVFLTVLGFGTGNLKDAKMEKLADHGNGNYAYIDNLLEARRVLVEQMGATLLTVAKDVKLQVEFNPAQVKAYRLIGYENRRLRDEEFNDDKKDAGDLGAGHSVTALYEVILAGSDEPIPGVDPLKYQQTTVRPDAAGSHEVLTVKLRYKPPEGSESRLLTRVLAKPGDGAVPTQAFRFAAAVAEFGLLLRDSPHQGAADYDRAFEEVRQTLGSDEDGRRSEFLSLIKTAKKLTAPAKIEGQVTDVTGAVMPGVEVTVTSDVTGQVWTDYTDKDGKYNFPILRPGSYTVQGAMDFFKITTLSGVQVESGRNVRLDLELDFGDVTETLAASAGGEADSPPPPPPPPAPPPLEGPVDSPGNSSVFGGELRFGDEIDPDRFNTEEYDRIVDNPFFAVREDPLATFSTDVDTAAYANVRRFLNQRSLPPRDAVRIEEMVNYFSYDYAGPADEHPVRIHAEVAGAPWNPEHRLVRLGVQGREFPLEERLPSNLVFLIDVSGSMQDANKLPLLKNGMRLLVEQLDENDRVAIVVFAEVSGMFLPSTPGDQKRRLLRTIDRLTAGGSTNGGEGIELAYDTAVAHFIEGGANRVILATDGDFNVGVTNNGALTRLIEEKAESGVFLSVLGFGTGDYNDAGLEALADHGNGNYAYIDTIREARKVLVEQMGRTLITIAKDVKIQVEFNPSEVNAYRLIGYENRVLERQDFNDDTKDAGEIGSGHTVTALFEVVPAAVDMPLPGVDPLKYQKPIRLRRAASRGELLTVKVRYKEPDGEVSRLMKVAVADRDVRPADASTDYRFATAVAGFGMILRDSPHKGGATFDSVLRLAEASRGTDEEGYRDEFIELVQKARVISLHLAVRNENPAEIQVLLDAGADPMARLGDGYTPLHWAVGNENPAVVEALLDAGADPMARGEDGATPLHWAARDSWIPAMPQTLLAAGAEVDARTYRGWTPLHWAVGNENPAVVEALLDAGADPMARIRDGETPLHWAVGNEDLAVIQALLAAGADPMARDNDGFTPLDLATYHPRKVRKVLRARKGR